MPTLEDDVDEGSLMEEVDYFWRVEMMVADVIKSWVHWSSASFYKRVLTSRKGD